MANIRPNDFYVDGDSKGMHALHRQNDRSTYFYYTHEYTLIGGLKFEDIEPARKIRIKIDGKYTLVLSRYHYWGLIVWINPREHGNNSGDTRPVIIFGRISHTPFLEIKDLTKRNHRIHDGYKLKWYQKIEWQMAKWLLVPEWYRIKSPVEYKSYTADQPSQFTEKWGFDDQSILNNSCELLLMGSEKDLDCIESKIRESNGLGITVGSLKQFLHRLNQKEIHEAAMNTPTKLRRRK